MEIVIHDGLYGCRRVVLPRHEPALLSVPLHLVLNQLFEVQVLRSFFLDNDLNDSMFEVAFDPFPLGFVGYVCELTPAYFLLIGLMNFVLYFGHALLLILILKMT